MLLSKAIRLGAMVTPQCFKEYYDRETGATCALGAAARTVLRVKGLEGAFWQDEAQIARSCELALRVQYPWCCEKSPVLCPECRAEGESPAHVIGHLNDYHRWSREAIADWVETLEREVPEAPGKHATEAAAICTVQVDI